VADELLTPREVADALGVTARTVQRWITGGRLPATRVGGRLRVSRSSLVLVSGTEAGVAGAPIASVLIANRGEIAVRIARTARRLHIRTVGVHPAGERPPDGMDATRSIGSYLDGEAIIGAARATGATAIHPGYGFLAENAGFAAAVIAAGLTWIGPPPDAIAAMGDKAAARRRAAGLGVPTLPGYDGALQDDETLAAEADRIGYPLLVKPSAGGGGKGMRVVRGPRDLSEALAAARREAYRAFGDDRLILERFLVGPRHVEIQVLFDAHGHGIHLGERDCSTQRRNQKVVEESPGPSVTPDIRARMGDAALRLAADVGYVGAGTVEFLLADGGEFFFLEMNTRLQVEHPVTEAVTGRDLVEDQFRIAENRPLGIDQAAVRQRGHAIEARIYAEDAEAGFLPATGRLLRVRWPSGDGIRIDSGVREDDEVSDRFDPMLAKVVAHGRDRVEALSRLRTALAETTILGVRTNVRFLRWLAEQPAFRDGEMRTDTLAGLALPPRPVPDADTWAAAGRALLAPSADAWGGGWRLNAPRSVRLVAGEEERSVPVPDGPSAVPSLVLDSGTAHVNVEGQSMEIALAPPPSIEEAVRHAATTEGHAVLAAPMPGRVVAVRAREGALVDEHAVLVVIEAMKMEHAVATPLAGTVTRIAVAEGDQVQRGDPLAEVTAYDAGVRADE
jgi:excisionase family DNA binding protein